MNITKHFMLACLSCLLLSACVNAKRIEPKYYMLEAPKNVQINFKHHLTVDPATADAPFDQLNLLYRINYNQYLIDYYNIFLISPSEQLSNLTTKYLANDKAPANTDQQYILQTKLCGLYADYRDRKSPTALMCVRFTLSKVMAGKNTLVFNKTIYSRAKLDSKTTASLIKAWNADLADIFKKITALLNNIS